MVMKVKDLLKEASQAELDTNPLSFWLPALPCRLRLRLLREGLGGIEERVPNGLAMRWRAR